MQRRKLPRAVEACQGGKVKLVRQIIKSLSVFILRCHNYCIYRLSADVLVENSQNRMREQSSTQASATRTTCVSSPRPPIATPTTQNLSPTEILETGSKWRSCSESLLRVRSVAHARTGLLCATAPRWALRCGGHKRHRTHAQQTTTFFLYSPVPNVADGARQQLLLWWRSTPFLPPYVGASTGHPTRRPRFATVPCVEECAS